MKQSKPEVGDLVYNIRQKFSIPKPNRFGTVIDMYHKDGDVYFTVQWADGDICRYGEDASIILRQNMKHWEALQTSKTVK